ncbi:type II secretion system protein GspK [Methylocystis parvus]|nr:type II secretion system protein GspK [Methylocystis parvus]WBK00100.1 type II secretion system protein GspK [Methylocystis parvus OBBP]
MKKKRAGFALLAVVWGTGLVAILVVAFMTNGRLRLQTAHNIASATEAGFIAESAINLATLALLAKKDAVSAQTGDVEVYDGAPRFCVLDRAAVALSVEEEGGKIDINAAPPELLQTVLLGLGLDERAAQQTAKAIVAFRTAPAGIRQIRATISSDKPIEPKEGLFETVLELDQVSGVSPALFRDLIPFVTVSSKSPGVDARTAPPALFAALAGYPLQQVRALIAAPYPNGLNRNDPRFPANFKQPTEHGAYLIHAEAVLATGQTVAKDALLDLRPASNKPFAFKEIRRGQSRYVDHLRNIIAANGAGVPDC